MRTIPLTRKIGPLLVGFPYDRSELGGGGRARDSVSDGGIREGISESRSESGLVRGVGKFEIAASGEGMGTHLRHLVQSRR